MPAVIGEKELNQEVQSKKSRYNQLGCGAIDPPGGGNENNQSHWNL